MLILSHREELVRQPLKWFSCSTGIEQGKHRSDHTEDVVSACTPSLVHRLSEYEPDEFSLIIVDECHHAGARSYKKILNHFRPEKLIGFTATPNRSDKIRLDDVFQKIIFKRDLRWAIENQWLCPIHCLRVQIGYDLSGVHIRNGDYAPGELEEAMDGTADAIAEAYRDYAQGATLIFAVSVAQCNEIAARIPGAVAVTGQTKDRAAIIEAFTRREIPCIVNCMVFTEGTDMPLVETVIVARPTTSEALYCLDEQTEILTDSGWKSDVRIGENVAAFDTESKEIKYVPVTGKIRRALEEEEYFCAINGTSCDIRVTHKHRLLYRNKQDKYWRIKTAEEVANRTSGSYIPVAGHNKFPGLPLTDDEIRFIGWVMTDGCINKYNNAICITQSSTQPWCGEIERIIKSCGFKFGTGVSNSKTQFNRNGDNIYWTISKGKPRGRDKNLRGWAELEPYISKDFASPLHKMTERQFDILLEACHLADGCKQSGNGWTQRSYHIAKGNKRFIENLQIAAIQRGWRANIFTETNGREKPIYVIHLKKQDFVSVGSTYDGRPKWRKERTTNETCWCVQNELGTLVTRRNGKVAIVGNCQMVGRGLRLHPDKEKLILIDCVGVAGKLSLCTAPSLLGVDLENVPADKRDRLEGDLFELPTKAAMLSDCPQSWVKNVQVVDLWAKSAGYNLHDMNLFQCPDGRMQVSLLENRTLTIPAPDALGRVTLKTGQEMSMQEAIDYLYTVLCGKFESQRYLWDLKAMKRWGKAPASDAQKNLIKKRCKGFDADGLTKGEASMVINGIKAHGWRWKG